MISLLLYEYTCCCQGILSPFKLVFLVLYIIVTYLKKENIFRTNSVPLFTISMMVFIQNGLLEEILIKFLELMINLEVRILKIIGLLIFEIPLAITS